MQIPFKISNEIPVILYQSQVLWMRQKYVNFLTLHFSHDYLELLISFNQKIYLYY